MFSYIRRWPGPQYDTGATKEKDKKSKEKATRRKLQKKAYKKQLGSTTMKSTPVIAAQPSRRATTSAEPTQAAIAKHDGGQEPHVVPEKDNHRTKTQTLVRSLSKAACKPAKLLSKRLNQSRQASATTDSPLRHTTEYPRSVPITVNSNHPTLTSHSFARGLLWKGRLTRDFELLTKERARCKPKSYFHKHLSLVSHRGPSKQWLYYHPEDIERHYTGSSSRSVKNPWKKPHRNPWQKREKVVFDTGIWERPIAREVEECDNIGPMGERAWDPDNPPLPTGCETWEECQGEVKRRALISYPVMWAKCSVSWFAFLLPMRYLRDHIGSRIDRRLGKAWPARFRFVQGRSRWKCPHPSHDNGVIPAYVVPKTE